MEAMMKNLLLKFSMQLALILFVVISFRSIANSNPIPLPEFYCEPNFLMEVHNLAPQITTQQFYLYNDGYESSYFFIEVFEDWLSVEPSSGFLEVFDFVLCTVTFNSQSLPPNGIFYTSIMIFDEWYFGSTSVLAVLETTIPCDGIIQVIHQGQYYSPTPIGNQCWLKENMNVGNFLVAGNFEQTNNGIIEKFCYNNNLYNCYPYGGLYTWDEAMQYGTNGTQGICPPGWRIPTDQDWITLEGETDSLFNPGSAIWTQTNFRGYDAGKHLKSIQGWNFGGNGTDESGFTGLPAGHFDRCGIFFSNGTNTYFWTSTENDDTKAWYRVLSANYNQTGRRYTNKNLAASVRCIKD